MAGWIKMRGELLSHPKVVAMARILHGEAEFRDWLTPGGGGPMNGQIVSHGALRSVTVGLLLSAWSRARESGEFDGNDLRLPHNVVDDLDGMAGAPMVGHAMFMVGWLIEESDGHGITLPNFKTYNAPMDAAERQQRVRDRAKTSRDQRNDSVTERCADVAPKRREEKRREDTKDIKTGDSEISVGSLIEQAARKVKAKPAPVEFPPELDTPEFREVWAAYVQFRSEQKFKPLGATAVGQKLKHFAEWGSVRAVAAIRYSMANGWQGIFEENRNGSGGNGKHSGSARLSGWERREQNAAREFPEDIKLPIA